MNIALVGKQKTCKTRLANLMKGEHTFHSEYYPTVAVDVDPWVVSGIRVGTIYDFSGMERCKLLYKSVLEFADSVVVCFSDPKEVEWWIKFVTALREQPIKFVLVSCNDADDSACKPLSGMKLIKLSDILRARPDELAVTLSR